MPVPTAISSLSQTAASNSPPGTESPTSADDYLRQQAAFIAMLRDGIGFTDPVQLASGATTSIGAQNSLFVEITGTTTITSFGTSYEGPRFLRFTGALTLTHNATTLNLPGAANITTAAGDTAIAIPNQAGNGWNVVQYQRASTPVTGGVIARAFGSYATNADLTTVIPADDTIPQNTEGTQIISVSLTPKSATNRVRLRFQGQFSVSASGTSGAVALFSSASANALSASFQSAATNGDAYPLICEWEYVPGVTTALTFTVRVGPLGGTATMRMNGTTSARLLGGVSAATLVVEEIAA